MCGSANKANVYKSSTGFIKYKTKIINILKLKITNTRMEGKMEEKYMVNDILENVKSKLSTYQDVITETENMRA